MLDDEASAIERQRDALRPISTGVDDGRALLDRAERAFAEEARARGTEAERHVLVTLRREFQASGLYAVGVVTAAFLAMPAGRTFAFLALAPAAGRAPGRRLRRRGASSRLTAAGESVDVSIDAATDLYLRDGARGGDGGTGARTVAFPIGRKLLVASGAGVAGIQLLRRDAPGSIAVSPAADTATDVAMIAVPGGGAVAYEPAAFVGAAVPRGAALPIERLTRWRDARSWATLRFRHYVFTGPGTLLLQGRRGVRARRAGDGWADDARLSIAFDAHLARGARRRGSLLRYLGGRQALFDDLFEGEGQVYSEHLPSRPIAADPASRILRRIGDVLLKPFGL